MNTKDMTLTAVLTAFLCVAGPLSVAVGPVPVSLATFAVYLAGTVLGAKRGTLVAALYIAMGAIGVPVFAGFTGGFQRLAGITGGYLVGYLPCAFLTGLSAEHQRKQESGTRSGGPWWRLLPGMLAGTVALYALGTAWFMWQSGQPLWQALGLCVLPFLPGDAIKIAAVLVITPSLRRALKYLDR